MASTARVVDLDAARQTSRAGRYAARRFLWSFSHDYAASGVRSCGRQVRSSAVVVRVAQHADGRREAGYGNLVHCGRVWSCPVCSARIMHARSDLLCRSLEGWSRKGGRVAMVTLTVRHRYGMPLRLVWDAVSAGLAAATSGSAWLRDQDELGVVPVMRSRVVQRAGVRHRVPAPGHSIPWYRVFEVTHGPNGWHVHVHMLLLLGPRASSADVRVLAARLWSRWDRAVQKAGLPGGDRSVGVDGRLVKGDPSSALGEYFSKSVYEVTGARFKSARLAKHRTPWQILAELVAGPAELEERRRLLAIWYEYEEGSAGRRLMGRSADFLNACGVSDADERTDAEIVDEELGGTPEAEVDNDLWREVLRSRLDHAVLVAFERSRTDGFTLLSAVAEGCGLPAPRQYVSEAPDGALVPVHLPAWALRLPERHSGPVALASVRARVPGVVGAGVAARERREWVSDEELEASRPHGYFELVEEAADHVDTCRRWLPADSEGVRLAEARLERVMAAGENADAPAPVAEAGAESARVRALYGV